MTRDDVFAAITAERKRQWAKWGRIHEWGHGDCSSPGMAPEIKMTVLAEEFGEVARAVLDRKPGDLRTELIQVAAVAVAWLEGLPE